MHSFGGARVPTPALYRYFIVHVVDTGPVGGRGTLRHVGWTLRVGGGQLHRIGHLQRPHERHRSAAVVRHGGRSRAQRPLPVHLGARILLDQTQDKVSRYGHSRTPNIYGEAGRHLPPNRWRSTFIPSFHETDQFCLWIVPLRLGRATNDSQKLLFVFSSQWIDLNHLTFLSSSPENTNQSRCRSLDTVPVIGLNLGASFEIWASRLSPCHTDHSVYLRTLRWVDGDAAPDRRMVRPGGDVRLLRGAGRIRTVEVGVLGRRRVPWRGVLPHVDAPLRRVRQFSYVVDRVVRTGVGQLGLLSD